MEPGDDKGVQRPMRRLDPAIIAAIALALMILIIGAVILLQGRNGGQDDRLGDNEVTAAQEDPEKKCAGQATYDQIKRELFRRAAQMRGSDQATFDKLAAFSSLRVEALILRDHDDRVGTASCSATFWLDLPPGVAVVGGRTSLTAEMLYTIQPAADGSGNVVTLANAEGIVTPLATLARVGAAAPGEIANDVVEAPIAPSDPLAPLPPSAPTMPTESAPPRGAGPSFDCDNARTQGEVAVCESPGLAALDRTMAAQFNGALSRADPAQRTLLLRTRDAFLRYRDNCPSDACIAQTYRGRIREIRDIMSGRWTPQR